jgi:TatD DNase family protein
VGGVIHCFDDELPFARAALDLGFCLSFSGMVTYASRDKLREVAAWAPLDRILVETDSPYLTPGAASQAAGPAPVRAAYVVHTARRVAEVRGMDEAALAAAVAENARRLFGVVRE